MGLSGGEADVFSGGGQLGVTVGQRADFQPELFGQSFHPLHLRACGLRAAEGVFHAAADGGIFRRRLHDLLQTLFNGIQAAAHTRYAQHRPAHAAHGGGNGVEFGRYAFQFGLQFAHPGRIGGGCLFQFPFSQRAACLQFGIGLFDLGQFCPRLVGFNAQNRLGFGHPLHLLRLGG